MVFRCAIYITKFGAKDPVIFTKKIVKVYLMRGWKNEKFYKASFKGNHATPLNHLSLVSQKMSFTIQ